MFFTKNFLIILRQFGFFSLINSALYYICLLTSGVFKTQFALFFLTSFFAGILIIKTTNFLKEEKLSPNQIMLLAFFGWISAIFFAFIPYLFILDNYKLSSILFEAVSGITTTGVTILPNPEEISKDILLWRIMTHAIGGFGILFLNLLTLNKKDNSEVKIKTITDKEISAEYNNIEPNSISKVLKYISVWYIIITVICSTLYYLMGMTLFDAICHSISTITTGGFCNYKDSVAFFSNHIAISGVASCFMFLGSVSFLSVFVLLKGKVKDFLKDEQFLYFVYSILIVAGIVIFLDYDGFNSTYYDVFNGIFTSVSVFTTTGFIPIKEIGTLYSILPVLTFFGGCIGSTSGGVKIGRVLILFKSIIAEVKQQIDPKKECSIKINSRVISKSVASASVLIVASYAIFTLLGALSYCLFESISFNESFSVALGMITNSGLTYSTAMHDGFLESGTSLSFKTISILLMIIGRMEIFLFLSIFFKNIWKQR